MSHFTLFEISRAPQTFNDLNSLFYEMRYNIWIPCLYDQVVDAELSSYPNTWKMHWSPISMLVDRDTPDLLDRLANDSRFTASRDEHLQFGLDQFMKLEQLKDNFPPGNSKEYEPADAGFFAWANMVDYLGRHFLDFLRRFEKDASSFRADRLPSLYIRALFVFYKYYIHGQSPGESDFMDFAHVSYAPYCETYVTERNASNVLKRIKKSGAILSDTRILHISDFSRELEEVAS